MDVFMTSSRGKDIRLPNLTSVGGGKVLDLTESGLKALANAIDNDPSEYHFLYIVAGIPDATEMIRMYRNYEEVIFNEHPVAATQRLTHIYTQASDMIVNAGAIPCFATITTMSLEDWNTTRLNQHITTHLIHYKHYADMQHLLNMAIHQTNINIIALNERNGVSTPHLSGLIMNSRGEGEGYRVRYNRLVDGCHPVDWVTKKWQKTLEEVASTNRLNWSLR